LPTQLALADCKRVVSFVYQDHFDSARVDIAEAKAALAARRRGPRPPGRANLLAGRGAAPGRVGAPDSGIALLTRVVSLARDDPLRINHISTMNSLGRRCG
jgi:hypothetical protein